MAVHCVHDICLCQEHEVTIPSLGSLNGLGKSETTSVLNIVRTHVDSHGEGSPMLWWWRNQVQAVNAMLYRSIETYDHLSPLPPIPLEVPVKMLRTPFCRIY